MATATLIDDGYGVMVRVVTAKGLTMFLNPYDYEKVAPRCRMPSTRELPVEVWICDDGDG